MIAWVCLAHVASMLCYAIYPTLLPQLQREWGASNSAAGLISGPVEPEFLIEEEAE